MAVSEVWMSEAEIRRELTGHAMKGYYPKGERWVDDYAADGSIAYHDEHVAWTGQWSFHGNVFCTFYNGETDGGCYMMRQLSKNCFEYVIVPTDWRGPGLAPKSSPAWFARGWRSEEPTTCEEPAVS
jgi:hypothetical protein